MTKNYLSQLNAINTKMHNLYNTNLCNFYISLSHTQPTYRITTYANRYHIIYSWKSHLLGLTNCTTITQHKTGASCENAHFQMRCLFEKHLFKIINIHTKMFDWKQENGAHYTANLCHSDEMSNVTKDLVP